MWYHYRHHHISIAKMRKRVDDVEQLELHALLAEQEIGISTWCWPYCGQLNGCLACDLAIALLGYPQWVYVHICPKKHTEDCSKKHYSYSPKREITQIWATKGINCGKFNTTVNSGSEWTLAICKNMADSHKFNVDWKKPDANKYISYIAS